MSVTGAGAFLLLPGVRSARREPRPKKIYRKSVQGDVRHCCRNCRYWPELEGQYEERNSKPVSGKLCDRCELMVLENDCTPLATIHFAKSI